MPLFQSTPPVKAATILIWSNTFIWAFQSTPPVKAATRQAEQLKKAELAISIHAAREGGDGRPRLPSSCTEIFQSTPPVKAATWTLSATLYKPKISIHAAREGGD